MAATVDPLTAGLGIIGLGMQIFGGIEASKEANKQAQLSQQSYAAEQKVNDQRRQAMELSASRQQLENYRNVQRVRAAGLNAAVSQGAGLGSGIAGGQAQAIDQGLFNSLGISQNLQIGRNIFGLNDQISGYKSQISQSQSNQATDQGWASLGGAIVKNSGTIGNIASFGGAQIKDAFSLFNPGTLSGGQGTT